MEFDADGLESAEVELVVFFGSRARGTASTTSDFDLGVLFAPNTDRFYEKLELVHEAISADEILDLVVLNEADPLLLREVALDGRPKFESHPGAFEEFRIRAFKLYMDTQWLRDLEAEALRSHYG